MSTEERRGRSRSIVSAGGGVERGERSGWVRDCRRRVWCVRWAVRAL